MTDADTGILLVLDAGHGETPVYPGALYRVGDVVRVRRLKHLRALPAVGVVAVVVPPDWPPEYALADATGNPRPLIISQPHRTLSYLVGFEGQPRAVHLRQTELRRTGNVAKVSWQSGDADKTDIRPPRTDK